MTRQQLRSILSPTVLKYKKRVRTGISGADHSKRARWRKDRKFWTSAMKTPIVPPTSARSTSSAALRPPSDLAGLAKYILSDQCKSIVALTGAGVSVASGIPDFRSPGGMYDTLRPDLITASPHERQLMSYDPTYVVSWEIFRQNQFPYLEVRRPFILGTRDRKWKATIAHRFFELLETKFPANNKKLTRLYTQNIDGLDMQCEDLPELKIVHVHGTLSKVQCEGCGHTSNYDAFCDAVRDQIRDIYSAEDDDQLRTSSPPSSSTNILCERCNQPLVKPSTVLFGRNLPSEFFELSQVDLPTCDLLLVAGTSLVVSPANTLVYDGRLPESTLRVIVNRDPVGMELGIEYSDDDGEHDGEATLVTEDSNTITAGKSQSHVRTSLTGRDLWAQGDCDNVFLELIYHLGWMNDLEAKSHLLPPTSAELISSFKHLQFRESDNDEARRTSDLN